MFNMKTAIIVSPHQTRIRTHHHPTANTTSRRKSASRSLSGTRQIVDGVPAIIILIKSKCHVDERLNTTLMRKIIITLAAAVPQKGYMCPPISG